VNGLIRAGAGPVWDEAMPDGQRDRGCRPPEKFPPQSRRPGPPKLT